ncbi:MAG: hypothetical protein ABJE47_12555 [bacterium]
MRKKLLLLSIGLFGLSMLVAKPAAAKSRFDCGDSCSNSTNCTTSGCIICFHAEDELVAEANKCK